LSFGAIAETYDRMRPPIYAPLVDRVVDALGLPPQACVLDLAAGTGRMTRELERRFARVVAVEPDDAMRALIDAGEVAAGTAESIPLAAGAVDAVVVCEAFHWFDTRPALAEIARVLVPGGGLAIVSTHWWETEPPLPAAAIDILREPYERFGGQVRTAWDAFADSGFEELREEEFAEALTVDADTLLAMYSTTSSLAALPTADRTALIARVRPLLGGPYLLPVRHWLRWTRLRVG
jgi:ubiquinone/menaquinone biosynthesis C-methylase UbiE